MYSIIDQKPMIIIVTLLLKVTLVLLITITKIVMI